MLAARLCGDIARQTLEGLTGFFVSWDRGRVGCGARYADLLGADRAVGCRPSHRDGGMQPSVVAPLHDGADAHVPADDPPVRLYGLKVGG